MKYFVKTEYPPNLEDWLNELLLEWQNIEIESITPHPHGALTIAVVKVWNRIKN